MSRRTNTTNVVKYTKEKPSSPNMKRSLTRKGSTEKMKKSMNKNNASGKSSTKKKLRRSYTEPNRNSRGSSSGSGSGSGSGIGGSGGSSSHKSRSGGSPQLRSGSPSSLAANKKRLQQKKKNGGKSYKTSSSIKKDSSIKKSWSEDEDEDEADSSDKKPEKRQKPSAMSKCMRAICGANSLVGDYEVTSAMACRTVSKLRLKNKDLRALRKSFEDIDIDESGEIDYDEFLEHMEERRNAFTDAVFRLIDENGDGVLEFDEFVSICGSFCMWNRGEILKFCFDTFDADGGGTIDEQEFEALAKTISHKDPTFPGNFQKALEEFDTNGDGLIDMDEFTTLNQRYPMVLFPMFRLQDKMQTCTLGLRRWNQIMKEQYKLRKIREYRLTHAGDLPPESCSTKMFRCGSARLGSQEDFSELEDQAKVEGVRIIRIRH